MFFKYLIFTLCYVSIFTSGRGFTLENNPLTSQKEDLILPNTEYKPEGETEDKYLQNNVPEGSTSIQNYTESNMDNPIAYNKVNNENINPNDNPDTNAINNPDPNPNDNSDSNPSNNPDTNPSNNPDTNPDPNPNDNPDTNPNDNPDTNPSNNPDTNSDPNPNDNSDSNPSNHPDTNPNNNPDTNPSNNPDTNHNNNSDTIPNNNHDNNPNNNPDTNPSNNPDTNPSNNPDTNPNSNPDTNHNNNSDTIPNNNPDNNPNNNPDTNPINDPDTNPSNNHDVNPPNNPPINPNNSSDIISNNNPSNNLVNNLNNNPSNNNFSCTMKERPNISIARLTGDAAVLEVLVSETQSSACASKCCVYRGKNGEICNSISFYKTESSFICTLLSCVPFHACEWNENMGFYAAKINHFNDDPLPLNVDAPIISNPAQQNIPTAFNTVLTTTTTATTTTATTTTATTTTTTTDIASTTTAAATTGVNYVDAGVDKSLDFATNNDIKNNNKSINVIVDSHIPSYNNNTVIKPNNEISIAKKNIIANSINNESSKEILDDSEWEHYDEEKVSIYKSDKNNNFADNIVENNDVESNDVENKNVQQSVDNNISKNDKDILNNYNNENAKKVYTYPLDDLISPNERPIGKGYLFLGIVSVIFLVLVFTVAILKKIGANRRTKNYRPLRDMQINVQAPSASASLLS